MAKRKSFSYDEFLNLYKNGNYQKLISKAKQFRIENLDEDEKKRILVDAYLKLSESDFRKGDAARALRDIDGLLLLDDKTEYQIIKLRYLCYLEKFDAAESLGRELLASQPSPAERKEIVFLYLLAKIYRGETTVDSGLSKRLPKSRRNYLQAMASLMKGETDEALRFLEECTPRSLKEKKNVAAIIAILRGERLPETEGLKPLYRYLLTGNAEHLPNTKGSRELRKELEAYFKKTNNNREIEALLRHKAPVEMKALSRVVDRKKRARLIHNNIALMGEKGYFDRAIHSFLENLHLLSELPESAFLLSVLVSKEPEYNGDRSIQDFLRLYLRKHKEKLSDFQLDYLYFYLVGSALFDRGVVKLAKEFSLQESMILARAHLEMDRVKEQTVETYRNTLKKYSLVRDRMILQGAKSIAMLSEYTDRMNEEKKDAILNNLSVYFRVLASVEVVHKRYKRTLLELLKSFSELLLNFDYEKFSDRYAELAALVTKYRQLLSIEESELPLDLKALFVSISRGKSVRNNHRFDLFDENMTELELLAMLVGGYTQSGSGKYDFNEAEYDLSLVVDRFIDAMKAGRDPFETVDFKPIPTTELSLRYTFALRVLSKAIELHQYNDLFVRRLMIASNLEANAKNMKTLPLSALASIPDVDPTAIMALMEYLIGSTPNEDRQKAWYLKMIAEYLNYVSDRMLPKSELFQWALDHFIDTQKRKNFRSIQGVYRRICERFDKTGRQRSLF